MVSLTRWNLGMDEHVEWTNPAVEQARLELDPAMEYKDALHGVRQPSFDDDDVDDDDTSIDLDDEDDLGELDDEDDFDDEAFDDDFDDLDDLDEEEEEEDEEY